MKGLFIVNSFLSSANTNETYRWLVNAAKRHGVDMDYKTNTDYYALLNSATVLPDPGEQDFILFWNKDVTLGANFEAMGYRLFNPSEAIRICNDKSLTTAALSGIVRMPKTFKVPITFNAIGYNNDSFIDFLGEELSYPFVIKECWGSYGHQVYLASSKKEAIEIFSRMDGTECIACEYIKQSKGRDLRAYVVGNRVVAAMERRNDNDFRANITSGGTSHPYKITKEQEEMAVTAAKALNLDFAGVDLLFLENDEPILCEVNSNAQFIGLHQATGIDITDAIIEHIIDVTK